jgi:SET domain-containing protein
MMIVPTYVGPSAIEGVGIFAAAPIRAGDPVWILEEKLDLLLPVGELAMLPELQIQFIERYGYPHMTRPGIIVLEFDNGRFMNHSHTPNTDFRNAEIALATRDIDAGEEITCNYGEFDPSFEMQPGRNFGVAVSAPPARGIAG